MFLIISSWDTLTVSGSVVLIPPDHINSLITHEIYLLAVFTDNPLKSRGYSGREHMFWATKESGVCNSMKMSVQVMREGYSLLHCFNHYDHKILLEMG